MERLNKCDILDHGRPKDFLEIVAKKERKWENSNTYILTVHGSMNINGYVVKLCWGNYVLAMLTIQ